MLVVAADTLAQKRHTWDFAFWALTLVSEPYIVDHLRVSARDWKSLLV